MQIKERNELKELLNEQEKLVSSLQQVYIVEEGETIAEICIKFYGSTEQEASIRLLTAWVGRRNRRLDRKFFFRKEF